LGGVVGGPLPKTLTLFMTKFSDFPYPINALKSLPSSRLECKYFTLFMTKTAENPILSGCTYLHSPCKPCIRLARGKYELTNQDSASGKNSSFLTSSRNQATFVTGDGIKYPPKGIYNFKSQSSWQKVKNMNHFVFLSFYFRAKNGSPALCIATRS